MRTHSYSQLHTAAHSYTHTLSHTHTQTCAQRHGRTRRSVHATHTCKFNPRRCKARALGCISPVPWFQQQRNTHHFYSSCTTTAATARQASVSVCWQIRARKVLVSESSWLMAYGRPALTLLSPIFMPARFCAWRPG
jgi:hypothetical protein